MTYESENEKCNSKRQQDRPAEIKGLESRPDVLSRTLQAQVVRDCQDGHDNGEKYGRDLDAKLPTPAKEIGHGSTQGGSEPGPGTIRDVDVALVCPAEPIDCQPTL